MKWTKAKYGSYIESGPWSIRKGTKDYTLNYGWSFVCILKAEAACKRVAKCIQKEQDKERSER